MTIQTETRRITVEWDLEVDGEVQEVVAASYIGKSEDVNLHLEGGHVLPEHVHVPITVPDNDVADFLSDNYGWCVKSWA